jgi:hypothetical protein
MGKSAKLTRGGNKKRVNVGRQEAKLKAQGAKTHVHDKTAKKESADGPKSRKAISTTLKSLAGQKSAVKMAPKAPKNAE